jgi:hypothetical protein
MPDPVTEVAAAFVCALNGGTTSSSSRSERRSATTRYVPFEDERKACRIPEMAGPPTIEKTENDDVTRQPTTMDALFLVVTLFVDSG